jgi:hypothetical protein
MRRNQDGSLTVSFMAGGHLELAWHLYSALPQALIGQGGASAPAQFRDGRTRYKWLKACCTFIAE